MKKTILSILIAGLFITGLAITSASAYGRGPGYGYGQGRGPCYDDSYGDGYGYGCGRGGGYGQCMRSANWFQQENLFVKALADASGKSEATIRSDLQKENVRYVMSKYNVDHAKLDAAMKKQSETYVKNAVKSGDLTKEQGDIALKDIARYYSSPK